MNRNRSQCEAVICGLGKLAALIVAAGALSLAPPLYAQRGGGGAAGGGGGSHGGGGGSVGGGWSGGGGSHSIGGSGGGSHSSGSGSGSHSSNGGSRGASGSVRGSSGRGASGSGRSGAWSGSGSTGNSAHRSGFSTAVRRFFGLPVAGRSDAEVSASNAAFSPDKLPPAVARVRFSGTSTVFNVRKPGAAILAPPRPRAPHPRRVGYYPPYGYCYACDVGFGLGFGFDFGFDLFDFGYMNWYAGPWHRQTAASADMILYLNDGSALEAADYWAVGDTLHYVTDDGAHRTIAIKDLDVQRTTDANERLGLRFTLDRTQGGTGFPKASR